MISRTRMLLFGIVFVLYCYFVQYLRLESGPIRSLFKFPDLTFSFQFSYGFFIFRCIIFDFFPQLLLYFKVWLLFHVKICLLVGRKRLYLCIFISNQQLFEKNHVLTIVPVNINNGTPEIKKHKLNYLLFQNYFIL